LGVVTSQICNLLDNIPLGILSSALTENTVRVEGLRILILSKNHPYPISDRDKSTAIQSLREMLFKILNSETHEIGMREAAHLVLKLESGMETKRYLAVVNHHLDSLFQFLENQLHSPLDPRPDWHEESIEHTLTALAKSARGNEAQLWEREIIQHLRSASSVGHSAGVRLMALRVIEKMCFDEIWATPDNIGTISLFLRDFWDQLPQGSQGTYAKSYAGALLSFSEVAGAHPSIFRDQWKLSGVLVGQKLQGSSELEFMIRRNLHGSLPALIRESGNTDASRTWLAMARRTLASLHDDSLANIEEAAAQVGLEAGRVEEVPVASGSQP
jgi:hypothetical protein